MTQKQSERVTLANEALQRLSKHLNGETPNPYALYMLGLGGDGFPVSDAHITIYVYLKSDSALAREAVPAEWEGFPVVTRYVGEVRPAAYAHSINIEDSRDTLMMKFDELETIIRNHPARLDIEYECIGGNKVEVRLYEMDSEDDSVAQMVIDQTPR